MSIPASLFTQPVHTVVQKRRQGFEGLPVQVSDVQQRSMPCNTQAQRAGMRYENRVGRFLEKLQEQYGAELHSHVWFKIGNRSAQTDFFFVFPSNSVILFEVKQTWVDTSDQLAMYSYILSELGFGPITCCTVCKSLTPETPRDRVIYSFDAIVEDAVWLLRI